MKKSILFMVVLIIVQTSCSTRFYRPRKSVNPGSETKIAVIAGMFDNTTAHFAEFLTDEFQKNTKFSVIPQTRLKSKNKHYPVRIKGPYSPSFFSIEDDYTLTDKEKILKYARSIKSDYVYVVWVPIVISGGKKDDGGVCNAIGQMFNVETGEEIGYGKFDMYWITGAYIGWGAARTQEEALKQGAEFAVKDISDKMGMSK